MKKPEYLTHLPVLIACAVTQLGFLLMGRDTTITAMFIKENVQPGLTESSVLYSHGRKHGGTRADMALESEPTVESAGSRKR